MDTTLKVVDANVVAANSGAAGAVQAPAWERLPAESGAAYRAFVRYRAMVPERRSLAALSGKRHVSGRISDWSRAHRWAERAAAWDDELERQHAAATIRARVAARERIAGHAAALETAALDRLLASMPEAKPEHALSAWESAAEQERTALGDVATGGAAAALPAAGVNVAALVVALLGSDASRAAVAAQAPQLALLRPALTTVANLPPVNALDAVDSAETAVSTTMASPPTPPVDATRPALPECLETGG